MTQAQIIAGPQREVEALLLALAPVPPDMPIPATAAVDQDGVTRNVVISTRDTPDARRRYEALCDYLTAKGAALEHEWVDDVDEIATFTPAPGDVPYAVWLTTGEADAVWRTTTGELEAV